MIIGEKVILEVVAHENIEQLRLWRNDPQMRKYFREWKDISVDKQEQWYKERGNNSNPQHVYFQIMALDNSMHDIEKKIENRYLIGCCGLHYIDWHLGSAEFGIFLGKDRGGGKGKEALTLMCDWGFKSANLHKIWAECFDNNESINLYRKIGFKEDGISRDSYFEEGKYGNSYLLSVLKNEWEEAHKEI